MTLNTTCLVTGANRGIGKGLVALYLARPHHTVIAAVRDPAHPSAQSLRELGLAQDANDGSTTSRLIIIQMDYASSASIKAAFAALASDHAIHSLDVVIANAGIGYTTGRPLAEESRDELQRFVEVNAHGPLELFGAALKMMQEAAERRRNEKGDQGKKPRFVLVSSNVGSFGLNASFPGYALYGASKAMANYLIKWLAQENKEVVAFVVHPGPVKTDMGNNARDQGEKMGLKLDLKWLEVEDSAGQIQKLIDDAESKDFGGRFLQYDGAELPW
ncbi:uncharacterized protein K452DRAFT_362457 [Aplosporella prunicola CBS 121167]|uniref:NAD(P)-binding protein n=1 Tax=Aplosporella prunicola CBS 121167 TaxID=1176127 RepID=A0A6A6AZA7_9PEZI|nr:uncharacterized protein K452DRAFT_362457 [Aplosporella prunicola CBS 121167]KAF2136523.1 hypothetical protein K452DRAFT_362457 [Aplosporella prunicola CBS 121167]